MITIKEIVLNEIGEGNIEPYPYRIKYDRFLSQYEGYFDTDFKETYKVNCIPDKEYLLVDFVTLSKGTGETNNFEQYKIMSTVSKILMDIIKKVSVSVLVFNPEKVKPKQSKTGKEIIDTGSKRANLYIAYIKKQLSKIGKNVKSIKQDGDSYLIEF